MSSPRQSAIETREKSWYENIIIIVVIALLMVSVISWYFKQEKTFAETGYTIISANFSSQLVIIRSKWLMDSKPNKLVIESSDLYQREQKLTKTVLDINNNGWVDSNKKELACQHIWQQVLDAPLVFANKPMSVVEVRTNNNEQNRVCQYINFNADVIEYHSENGMVKIKSNEM